jgi:hypothetical protein
VPLLGCEAQPGRSESTGHAGRNHQRAECNSRWARSRAQPAIDERGLGALRNLFGDPLLERAGRDHRLTPLALQLAEPVRSILVSIERTLIDVTRQSEVIEAD